jgi:hypothetical protein
MVVQLVSCYFLPFLLFFVAQIVLPKSIGACALGISVVSLGTLFLYYCMRIQESEMQMQELPPVVKSYSQQPTSPITSLATRSLKQPQVTAIPNTKALIATLEREKREMIAFYEGQGRDFAAEMQTKERLLQKSTQELEIALQKVAEYETLMQSQMTELENLKFEMRTLLRVDSYATA